MLAQELVDRMKNAMKHKVPAETVDRSAELIPGMKYLPLFIVGHYRGQHYFPVCAGRRQRQRGTPGRSSEAIMNQSQFQQAAGISAGLSARWFPHIDAAMKEFGITAVNDQAMFIAQVGHESAGFTSLAESFNYSVEGLKKTFGKRLTPYQCEMLGRVDGKQVAHQPQIANLVYGDRMGNNSQGDGWKYRGRGLLQITGRENYTKCGAALKLDLISTPELLTQERHAARSAAWYFTLRGCLLYSGDVERVTQIINGGQNGINDRRERYAKAKAALV